MLPTTSNLPFDSPLAGIGAVGAPGAVELADLSDTSGLLHLRGRDSEAALIAAFGEAPNAPGGVHLTEGDALARLTHDEFALLLAKRDGLESTIKRIQTAASGSGVTITDLTHGRGQFRLSGPRAADVLPKLCGLDFSEATFPAPHAAQTSFARVKALIVRLDHDVYHLAVDRSLAAYVWKAVADAMQEFLL